MKPSVYESFTKVKHERMAFKSYEDIPVDEETARLFQKMFGDLDNKLTVLHLLVMLDDVLQRSERC